MSQFYCHNKRLSHKDGIDNVAAGVVRVLRSSAISGHCAYELVPAWLASRDAGELEAYLAAIFSDFQKCSCKVRLGFERKSFAGRAKLDEESDALPIGQGFFRWLGLEIFPVRNR